ncbi:hypothetical protein D6D05_01921 [Aureobasidium pullulans]|nr:hypothetical protein D6D05_01921 [Aureobasidium pullulans]
MPWDSPKVEYNLASSQPQLFTEDDCGRSFPPTQAWPGRLSSNASRWFTAWSRAGATPYNLVSDVDDMDTHNQEPAHGWSKPAFRIRRRVRFRRCVWMTIVALPTLVILVIILIATLHPSYSHPPHHYHVLRGRALGSTQPGRANPRHEKIFIASSIYDKQGRLAAGEWGKGVLALVDLLGPDNVFLSVFEDDPDTLATAALQHFTKQIKCNSSVLAEHIDRGNLPHVKLPNGEKRLKRIEFLAHVRNRALAPLDDPTSSAYSTHFDKLLYINDVVFDPIDAANLLFSTNVDKSGKTQYHAACAADFINPFKYYDTFATRDHEGNRIGVPVYPWFSSRGRAESRKDVFDQKDAVRVRSCWGGMVAFNARWLQPDGLHVDLGVADLVVDHNTTTPSSAVLIPIGAGSLGLTPPATSLPERDISLNRHLASNVTLPIRFRASTDTFWDASECCLIHADIGAASNHTGLTATGIYLNPYIRVAYSSRTLAFLHITRRFERVYTPFHKLIGWSLNLPTRNPRRMQEAGKSYEDMVWENNDPESMHAGDVSAGYKNKTRVALPGGFCGSRKLSVLGEGPEMRKWYNEVIETPTVER